MHDGESATLIIAIIGALIVWTSSIVAMISWLNGKFRFLEQVIYKEDAKIGKRISRIIVRTQRLEAKSFGVTHSGEFESESEAD